MQKRALAHVPEKDVRQRAFFMIYCGPDGARRIPRRWTADTMPNASSPAPGRLRIWFGAVCERTRALLLPEGGMRLS